MKITITKCYCDYCEKEMTQSEYSDGIKINLRVDAPLPGQCGECATIEMKLCTECCEKIGIVNKPEYHETIYSQNRLRNDISKNKGRILEFFSKRKGGCR